MNNKARNSLYGELDVIRLNKEQGTFEGKDSMGCIYSKLSIDEFYFYEFR